MPELSAGDFLRLIENKFHIIIGEVLLLLSPSLTEEQRANLVNDFQLARAHLLFALSLKTAALQELPLRLFVIAHHNRVVARNGLAFCMLSTGCLHPKIKALQQEPLQGEAQQFLQGVELSELPALFEFIGMLMFAFSVDLAVEGQHARIHKGISQHYGTA